MNTPETKYSFVKKYTLVDPKEVFLDYEYFSLCETTPTSIEGKPGEDFHRAIPFPTEVILPILRFLKKSPAEISKSPLYRTVYEIQLKNNETAYVVPSIKYTKCAELGVERKRVAFNVTPEINRAIIDCVKTFTRA